MTYSKPEILEMGEAINVIQGIKLSTILREAFPFWTRREKITAYDLDE